MTLAQQFEQRGEKAILLRQLKYRFKNIPEIYQKCLDQADSEMLLKFSERLLEAVNIDEVFRPLKI